MPEIVISYVGAMPHHDGQPVADVHRFVPCFEATRDGEPLLKVWAELSGFAATMAKKRMIEDTGISEADAENSINDSLMRYGVRRLESILRDLVASGASAELSAEKWRLGNDDVSHLLSMVRDKCCEYQARARRDLFCVAAAKDDTTADKVINGRRAAPTSRPLCRACTLPSTDYICSHLLHPGVTAVTTDRGTAARRAFEALCDQGRTEIGELHRCHAGGHECWQRLLDVEPPALAPISPLSLPESFDTLDAMWRLAFGKKMRLVSLTTTVSPAALSLGCSARPEFESRISSLADVLDKLRIDKSLLPPDLPEDALSGSLDAIEQCLIHRLPIGQHAPVLAAIKTLRRVRQARNAIAHGITEGGGLVSRLRELGIYDAPPNWAEAWDNIRVQTADALTVLRNELRQWVDSTA
jgi:hypothetical protein